jgi:4-amino-4-deoxy-L-arabinose transferase-like glycosyltransferase
VLWPRVGARRSKWAILILATSGLAIASAKMCLTDAVLLLWITIAQLCLYRIVRGGATADTWLWTGAAVGLAGLTKGPVALGVMGTTLLVLGILRWWDRARPQDRPPVRRVPASGIVPGALFALVVVALICGPWLALIHRREPSFLPTIVGHDVINRMKTGLEGHSGAPGYYLLSIWATFFPWSLFLPAALVYAWKHRHEPMTRFALAAVIGPWLMFELVRTKLPHYVLPIFPPLAFLTARMLVSAARKAESAVSDRAFRIAAYGWCALVLALSLAPLALFFWLSWRVKAGDRLTSLPWAIAFALAGSEYARSCWMAFRARKPLAASGVMGIGIFVLIPVLYAGWIARCVPLLTSVRVAEALRDEGAHTVGDVIMIDYKEPSLAFHQGGSIREESNDRFLIEHPNPLDWPPWIVITQHKLEQVPPETRARLEVVAAIDGFWYASGARPVRVLVLRKRFAGG